MGFFDNAQEVLDRGVSAAKGAVSGVAVEQQAFVKGFARLCSEGSIQPLVLLRQSQLVGAARRAGRQPGR